MSKNLHDLIVQAKQYFNEKNIDNYGCCNSKNYGCVSVRATLKNSERALNIMNKLINSLEKFGYKIGVDKDYRSFKTYALIKGEKVSFAVEECLNKIPHVPTAIELERKEKWGYTSIKKYDYVPSNRFVISIKTFGVPRSGIRFTYSDYKDRRVENRIQDFILQMEEVAFRLNKERLIKLENDRIRRENEIKERDFLELKKAENEKIEILNQMMKDYYKSKKIREFIEEVKGKKLGPIQVNIINWAKEYADHLDPTNEFLLNTLIND